MIVFRASGIGFPCPRKVWYEAIAGHEEKRSVTSEMTLDMGTAIEPLFVKYLSPPYDEWEILYNPGSQQAEKEVIVPVDTDIVISGHPDAMGMRKPGGDWILPDFKTMNSFAYKQWRQHGAVKKYPQYVIQLHCYGMSEEARKMGIETYAIAGMNKDRTEHPIPIEFIDRDPALEEWIRKYVRELAVMVEPPEPPATIPAWCCKYCGFKGNICQYEFFN